MTQPDVAHYELAQNFVASGAWTVDPERGEVCGLKGQPFRRTNSWGYIQIKFRRPEDYRTESTVLAHRVIWEAVHGPVPPELQINHRNGVKTDNRLENLEAVTSSANVQHAYSTGLSQPNRATARLTADQALEIHRRCQAGERDTPLAVEFGVSRSVVSNIRNGWSWAHVTGQKSSGPRPARVRPSRRRVRSGDSAGLPEVRT